MQLWKEEELRWKKGLYGKEKEEFLRSFWNEKVSKQGGSSKEVD